MSNDSIRRIMAEVKEFRKLNEQPSTFFHAAPLETDLFEWHFSVRGPPDTAFADGVYHGRIVLPAEYPLKAPEIILLTPNGRFEVGKRICLSVTAHHQETWQPSWGIRTILTALVGFMPSKAEGVAALDYPDADRRRLARLSWSFQCKMCQVRPITLLYVPAAVKAGVPGAYCPEELREQPESQNEQSNSGTVEKKEEQEQSSSSGKGSEKTEAKTDKELAAEIEPVTPAATPVSSSSSSPPSLVAFASSPRKPVPPSLPKSPISPKRYPLPSCCSSSSGPCLSPASTPSSSVTAAASPHQVDPPPPPPPPPAMSAESSPSNSERPLQNPETNSDTPQPPAATPAQHNSNPITTNNNRQQQVKEPELLYLAYAIVVAIVAIILRRVYVTITAN